MSMVQHTRRDFLSAAARAAVLSVSGTTALSSVSAFATPPLPFAAASAVPKLIPYGAAARSDALAADPSYRAALAANCQMIVPESELKWAELRPSRDQFRFERADAILNFAQQTGIDVRGHALAWHGPMPAWTDAIASRVEAEHELVTHIQRVVSRYRGAIRCWDVVNEPLAYWPEDEFAFRPSLWASRLRADYLPVALRAAAQADPDARLVLNECDLEFIGPRFVARRHALIRLLRALRERDVPLHAVGLQAHLFADRAVDRDGLQALLAEIAKLRLDLVITELDVIDYELPAKVSERDARVARLAAGFLKTVCEVTCPKAIVTWGLSDRYSWVPTYFKRPDGMPNRPLPLDADLAPKPLYDVIEQFRRSAA